MNTKKWYASKTLWINGVAALVAVLSALDTVVPSEYLPYVMAAAGIANIVLRLLKNEQVKPIEGSPL